MHGLNRKFAAALAAMGALAASTHAALVDYAVDPVTGAGTVTYDTAELSGWLTDGLIAGILVGAVLFGIAVGTKYLVKLIRRIGS